MDMQYSKMVTMRLLTNSPMCVSTGYATDVLCREYLAPDDTAINYATYYGQKAMRASCK